MKLKHTPGPHKLEISCPVNKIRDVETDTPLALILINDDSKANGLLYAAAPEMLAALILAYKDDIGYKDSDMQKLIKAVIEKATGMKIYEVLSDD